MYPLIAKLYIWYSHTQKKQARSERIGRSGTSHWALDIQTAALPSPWRTLGLAEIGVDGDVIRQGHGGEAWGRGRIQDFVGARFGRTTTLP